MNKLSGLMRRTGVCLVMLFWLSSTATGSLAGDTLTLAIQPILSEEKTIKAFTPLARYLSRVTGKRVVIKTAPNFLSYWTIISRSPKYDLILDAAHFTDYRIKKMGYSVLCKIPDGVSYSIITHDNNLLLDHSELVGKTVASLGSPSIGAARLDSLFPNPSRQPIIIEIQSVRQGIKMLLEGKVFAAIIPTPIVGQQMNDGAPISVVETTELVPHIALSVAPSVDAATRDKIRQSLVNAHKTVRGKAMLKGIGFAKFDPANPKIYAGQSDLLKIYWGY